MPRASCEAAQALGSIRISVKHFPHLEKAKHIPWVLWVTSRLVLFFLNCLVAIPDVRCVWNGRLNLYRAITSCIGSGYDAIFNIFTGE